MTSLALSEKGWWLRVAAITSNFSLRCLTKNDPTYPPDPAINILVIVEPKNFEC